MTPSGFSMGNILIINWFLIFSASGWGLPSRLLTRGEREWWPHMCRSQWFPLDVLWHWYKEPSCLSAEGLWWEPFQHCYLDLREFTSYSLGYCLSAHFICVFVLDPTQKSLESSVGVWIAVSEKNLVIMMDELVAESEGIVLLSFVNKDWIFTILNLTASSFPTFAVLDWVDTRFHASSEHGKRFDVIDDVKGVGA